MANLSDYLKKFSVLLNDRTEEKKAAFLALHELGFCNNEKEIEIKENILVIQTSPSLRSELFLRKSEIVNTLQTKGVKIIDFRW